MKNHFGTLAVAGLSLMVAHSASAAVIAQYDFDVAGTPEGWNVVNGVRQVAGDGVMRVRTGSNDPQVTRNVADELTRLPGSTNFTTFEVLSRELDEDGGSPIAFDPTGTVLIFGGANQGAPDTVGAADANGFQLLTWDISSVVAATSGNIRFDFFGGPGTSDAPANVGEVDFIRVSDNSVIPEPASLALLGLGGMALLGRRRK